MSKPPTFEIRWDELTHIERMQIMYHGAGGIFNFEGALVRVFALKATTIEFTVIGEVSDENKHPRQVHMPVGYRPPPIPGIPLGSKVY